MDKFKSKKGASGQKGELYGWGQSVWIIKVNFTL